MLNTRKSMAADGNFVFEAPKSDQQLLSSRGPRREKYLQPFSGRSAIARLRGVLSRGDRRKGCPREDEWTTTQKPGVVHGPLRAETRVRRVYKKAL